MTKLIGGAACTCLALLVVAASSAARRFWGLRGQRAQVATSD